MVRERTQQATGRLEEFGKEHQVQLRATHVLGPKHLAVVIFEASGIEAVRDFMQESGIVQWNDTELYPSQTMQEAMQSVSSLPPIR